MKNIKYILVAFACCLFTGCMDEDWDTPDTTDAFGNKNIVETNIVTIKSLKDKYTSVINASSNSYQEITDDIQIKGRVVGNDKATSTTRLLSTTAQAPYSSASRRVACSPTCQWVRR